MFDGLDQAPWHDHQHAYGPATDVPRDLRDLRSRKPKVRSKALGNLYGSIFHQGTRWRASKLAVPFLVELLTDRSTPDRAELAKYLLHLTVGYLEQWWATPIDRDALLSGDELLAAGNNEYEMDERDVYDAVCSAGPELHALAVDADSGVRTWIAVLLGLTPDVEPSSGEVLLDRFTHEDRPGLRANALIAYALLSRSQPTLATNDFSAHLDHRALPVRAAAAVAEAHAGRRTERVLDILVEASASSLDLPHWESGGTASFFSEVIRATGSIPETTIPALAAQLRASRGLPAVHLGATLLTSAFPNPPIPQTFAELDHPQQSVLLALRDTGGWTMGGHVFANFSLTMRNFGLPSTQGGMAAYCDGTRLEDAVARRDG